MNAVERTIAVGDCHFFAAKSHAVTDQWYFRSEGQTHGPVPRRQLEHLAAAGRLDKNALVWRDGLPDWISFSSLGPPGGAQPPPLPPPPPIAPPAPPRNPVARKPRPQPPSDSLRWALFAAVGIAALFLAGAVGWVARGVTASRGDGLAATARVPASSLPSASQPRTAPTPVPSDIPPSRPVSASQTSASVPVVANPVAASVQPPANNPPAPPAAAAPPGTAASPPPSPSAPPPENPPPASPPVPPQSEPAAKAQVLFQEIDVERMPKFAILGTETVQHLQYQILSELRVGPADDRGNRQVAQSVQDARLVKSDDLSREMYTKSLRELVGWQFSMRLNRHGEVIEIKSGPDEGRRAAAIEPKGGKGFLVTTVMDEAGWKELAQLSFFPFDPQGRRSDPIVRQMTHDFGPLGSWSGTTRFVPKGSERGLLRIDYAHDMTYQPPEKDAGELPFAVKDARFAPEVAGGTIYFDSKAGRVHSAQDRFVVRGEIATELLGQAATVQVEEQQAITVRLHDQDPWGKLRSEGNSEQTPSP